VPCPEAVAPSLLGSRRLSWLTAMGSAETVVMSELCSTTTRRRERYEKKRYKGMNKARGIIAHAYAPTTFLRERKRCEIITEKRAMANGVSTVRRITAGVPPPSAIAQPITKAYAFQQSIMGMIDAMFTRTNTKRLIIFRDIFVLVRLTFYSSY
jgi:hypothetical protein